jgi:excisionase family DNA binding protein
MTTTETTAAPLALARENAGPAPLLAVTISEACRITGIGKTTLYGLIADGKLPLRRIRNRSVIPFDDLKRLIETGVPDEAAA